MTGHRDHSDSGFLDDGCQLAEEIQRVGLVTGPLPTEHVGVEDHDLHASSRHNSTTASAARFQVNALARSMPGETSSSRRAVASPIPAAIEDTSSGSTRTAAPPATSAIAVSADVTTGVPQAIASSTGSPNPSYSDV